MVKVCTTCKHFDGGNHNIIKTYCKRSVPCPVYGERPLMADPLKERTNGVCGPKGVFHVERPAPPVPWRKRFWMHLMARY